MKTFGEILDLALAQNIERQVVCGSKLEFPPHLWLRERATVNLNYGRQTGKTTALMRRATSRDLVVLANTNLCKEFLKNTFYIPHVVTINSLKHPAVELRGHHYDRMWVDDASYMKKEQIDDVYIQAVLCRASQVILIG